MTKLVYYEEHEPLELAIEPEKKFKNWHRDWRLTLIRSLNPEFRDPSEDFGSGLLDSSVILSLV